MEKKILFVGDANLDLILSGLEASPQEDKEVFCDGVQYTLGGSCTLTASAYAHLGGHCDFSGLIGHDTNGIFVRDALVDAGVGVDLLRMDDNLETGLTVNLIHGRSRTQVTYRGSLSEVNESDTIQDIMNRYAHLHLSGIYGTPKLLPHIEKILRVAKNHHLTTSLDTQWDASGKWQCINDWLPLLDWLIINEDEALSISKRLGFVVKDDTTILTVWNFLKTKTPSPIIKLGKIGAFAQGNVYPPCDVEKIVDTTGAGDSFAATFIYAIVEKNYDFEQAMTLAQAGGALACTFVGGYSEVFSLSAIEALL